MDRPAHLPPGTLLGHHYAIEGLVRLAEGRMFYLANDNRPDVPKRRCWECQHPDSLRAAEVCASCGKPLEERRFLVSSRWNEEHYEAYERFVKKQLIHPGLATPIDAFRQDGVLYSVIMYGGEGLMLDEAAPLPNARILDVAQRTLGTMAFLHTHGVSLHWLTRANMLIAPSGSVRLFDVEVAECFENGTEVTLSGRQPALLSLATLLRRYADVQADDLLSFLYEVENSESCDPVQLGRDLERRHELWSATVYPALIGGMTDVGLTRQLNEDNLGWKRLSDRASLFVVADGMGGHDCGELASMLAVKTICDVALEHEATGPQGDDALESMFDESFQKANNTIKDQADAKGTDMGTTMVSLLVVDQNTGFMANVGDSRGYLLREGALHQVSKDHSLVQKMVERGRITPEEARHHPHSNILLRTVGTERDIDIDIFRVELESGDKVMMCSDGLWGEVEDRDIESILNTYSDPRIAARELVRAAHHGGGKDNVTLMIVTVP